MKAYLNDDVLSAHLQERIVSGEGARLGGGRCALSAMISQARLQQVKVGSCARVRLGIATSHKHKNVTSHNATANNHQLINKSINKLINQSVLLSDN